MGLIGLSLPLLGDSATLGLTTRLSLVAMETKL